MGHTLLVLDFGFGLVLDFGFGAEEASAVPI
jgi:hypothetical protein